MYRCANFEGFKLNWKRQALTCTVSVSCYEDEIIKMRPKQTSPSKILSHKNHCRACMKNKSRAGVWERKAQSVMQTCSVDPASIGQST